MPLKNTRRFSDVLLSVAAWSAVYLQPLQALADVVPSGRAKSPEERAANMAEFKRRSAENPGDNSYVNLVAAVIFLTSFGFIIASIVRLFQTIRAKDADRKKALKRDIFIFFPAGLFMLAVPIVSDTMPATMLAAFVAGNALVAFLKIKRKK